jgi:DNA-binding MarR family transcriptional regulator
MRGSGDDDRGLDTGRIGKLAYIRSHDPDGADKLENLLRKKDVLMTGNSYGERMTERQFSLVFDPLLARAVERSQILENLGSGAASVPDLSRKLGIAAHVVFDHLKELSRRDLVEVSGYEERSALYRRK